MIDSSTLPFFLIAAYIVFGGLFALGLSLYITRKKRRLDDSRKDPSESATDQRRHRA